MNCKKTVKTSRAAGYLEKIFRALNERYFDNELEEPIITIQSTPRAYGHVTVEKSWSRADGEKRHELNIGAGTLGDPIESVSSTLLHECCHLYNLQHGIQDCSRGGTYHNKQFKETAESRDLIVSKDKRTGWGTTEPSDALIEFIIEQGWEDICMNRNDGSTSRASSKPSSTIKLLCPQCGQSVRATRKGASIICGFCSLPMVRA